MNHGTIKLGANLTFYANTHTPSTGAAVDADAVPGYRVYEDETATPLLTGSMALLDDANTTGFYSEQIAVTTANGFEAGKSYCIRITGVVGGVTGVELHYFNIQTRSADDLAYPATSGRSLDVDANGKVILQATQTGVTIPTVTTLTNVDDVWEYTTRTLTSTAASTIAAVSGSSLAVTKYADFDATLTGLTISASWTKQYLTVKRNASDDEADAILQIMVTNPADATNDGVIYVNGAAATSAQRTLADLTVTQAAGTIAIHQEASLNALLPAGNYTYDRKELTATTAKKIETSAAYSVDWTETQAVA